MDKKGEALNTLKDVNVIKCDHLGNELWRYSGDFFRRMDNGVIIKALFNVEKDVEVDKLIFSYGDVFFEAYYWDRWFNIFEVYDGRSEKLKGWYCNITYPAKITDSEIKYRDLVLDLLVYPDGQQVVLDEGEFLQLDLDSKDKDKARQSLSSLKEFFSDTEAFCLKDGLG